jgi:hypothetical protein
MVTDNDEFVSADREAGVAVIPPGSGGTPLVVGSRAAFRNTLVEQYHKGSKSLVERLKKDNKADAESLLICLIDEVIGESDHLLGNELVATENGDLRDASVISYKRAEVLEKAIKAVQARNQVEKESGVDLDSPSMMVVFRFFMFKVKETFKKMGISDEQSDIFFRTLGEEMEDWKKELREQLSMLKGR